MSEREEEKMTLVHAAYRVCDLAVRIEQAKTEEEENDLCNQRDCFLSLFRKADASRQSILEEAAKVAEEMGGHLKHLGATIHPLVQIGSHLETCATIAKAIRSLSHDGKAPAKEGDAG